MSQEKAPPKHKRFPLKSCFKRIFQDCSMDFQMCLWFEYLDSTCEADPHSILENYPKNIKELPDLDYWTAEGVAVLAQGIEGVIERCLHPGNDAPGVHAWVHARYHPKTVFRMIDAMLQLLYSICVYSRSGLRHGLERRKGTEGTEGAFYRQNPVFLGKATAKYPNIPKEHTIWLGQIDACLRQLLGDEKYTSGNLDGVLEGFNAVKAKYGAKPGAQKNVVLALLNPSKGPRGTGGLFDVLSSKLRAYFNFFGDGAKRKEAAESCQRILKTDDRFGAINFYPSALAFDAEGDRAFFEPLETIRWVDTRQDRYGRLMQCVHTLPRRRLFGNLIRLAGHPKDFEDFMDKIFTGNPHFLTFDDQDGLNYFKSDRPIVMERYNSDVIREALEREDKLRSPTPSLSPWEERGEKRPADEVEFDLPNHGPPPMAKKPMKEPKKNNSVVWLIGGGIVLVMAFIRS